MSETRPLDETPLSDLTPAQRRMIWGSPIVAVYAMTIFVVALIIAYMRGTENLLTILLGVAAANATTAVNYYLGSSFSSMRKDLVIHDAQQALAKSTPPAGGLL